MHFNEFMQNAEALEPGDIGVYFKLEGWCGMDRPAIDSIADGMVRFTAKHFIGVTAPQDLFKIDTDGNVYLHGIEYLKGLSASEKAAFMREHHDPKRPNFFTELPF